MKKEGQTQYTRFFLFQQGENPEKLPNTPPLLT
jgi:hypothetical protein